MTNEKNNRQNEKEITPNRNSQQERERKERQERTNEHRPSQTPSQDRHSRVNDDE